MSCICSSTKYPYPLPHILDWKFQGGGEGDFKDQKSKSKSKYGATHYIGISRGLERGEIIPSVGSRDIFRSNYAFCSCRAAQLVTYTLCFDGLI